MIMMGKYKQGDVWLEAPGDVPCPVVCRNQKCQTADGYLTPAYNQFIALNQTAKYSILPAKERTVVTHILMRPEHIAFYQHTLLAKHSFPVPALAYLVRKRLTKNGPDPYEEDADTKELRENFVVAGLRVQHEDEIMLVPFCISVDNKTGLVVSQEGPAD